MNPLVNYRGIKLHALRKRNGGEQNKRALNYNRCYLNLLKHFFSAERVISRWNRLDAISRDRSQGPKARGNEQIQESISKDSAAKNRLFYRHIADNKPQCPIGPWRYL